ncbi:CbiQ family ECF transporter T component [Luteococcus sp. Sow4_B9]|uniref:CbiQ family ECF transporter T component n=1 Tax=Luteococcus sp. Sow4_B9 TaxID=3438792 RepID=UPI003F988D13
MARRTVARAVHPMAWWGWALGCAVAVSLLHNPLVVVLATALVWLVVLERRSDAPWARSTSAYLTLALVVLGIRMIFQVFMGVNRSGQVLFTLPSIELPAWAAGVRLGGPVTLDALLYTLYDSLRLVAMLLCVGAANSLANPRRALRSVPPALYQLSVALVVALSVAPQLIESVGRVRRARRLRGGRSTGWRAAGTVLVPVLEDAIDRSLLLAAGMESRGYGRTHQQEPVGPATTGAMLASMVLITYGTFLLLGVPGAGPWSWSCLVAGCLLAAIGIRLSGRRLAVTRYRPDAWGAPEHALCMAGLVAALSSIALVRLAPDVAMTPASPPQWPLLHLWVLPLLVAIASPLFTTPLPTEETLAKEMP